MLPTRFATTWMRPCWHPARTGTSTVSTLRQYLTAARGSRHVVDTMDAAMHTKLGRCRTCIALTAGGLVLSWTAFVLAAWLLPNALVAALIVPVAIAFTLLASMHAGAMLARARQPAGPAGAGPRCRP